MTDCRPGQRRPRSRLVSRRTHTSKPTLCVYNPSFVPLSPPSFFPSLFSPSGHLAAAAANAAAAASSSSSAPSGSSARASSSSKDIWSDAEVAGAGAAGGDGSGGGGDDDDGGAPDPRKRPDFEVLFKQKVGAEDVFLGMSGTTPSSIHCDTLVVKVKLPGATLRDVDLDVTETRILVATATHRLSTYLPLRVRHKEGKAQWDGAKETLSVTLPIVPNELWSGRG